MSNKIVSLITSAFSFILLFPVLATAQSNFEGKINIKTTYGKNSIDWIYYIKDNMVRFEPGEELVMFTLVDAVSKEIYMVLPAGNIYVEVNPEAYFAPVEANAELSSNKMQPTGETKDIHGYLCEKWIHNGENGKTEAWLAMDLGPFLFLDTPARSKSDWHNEIESTGYFPMLIIHKNTLDEVTRYEVTSIEKKQLPTEFFSPPESCQKMEVTPELINKMLKQ